MDIKRFFYKIRLSFLMYGFAWIFRIARIINGDFRAKLTQNDFAFTMGSKDGDTVRYFQFIRGKLRSGCSRIPRDFALIWRDNQAGGRAMMDILLGKPKVLYHAVTSGLLLLEGDGKSLTSFMAIMNQLNRLFRPKKKAKNSGKVA